MSYVSLDKFKKYSGAHDDDDMLQVYIDSAEAIVKNYLGYSPVLHVYENLLNGYGNKELKLRARPIQEILLVEINNEVIPVNEFHILDDSEYIYSDICFSYGKNNIKVSYKAGYGSVVDDDEACSEDIPIEIRMTVFRIASILQAESDSNIAISSKSFQDSGTRTFINDTDYSKYLLPISSYKLLVI
jgi:hypothetical protein